MNAVPDDRLSQMSTRWTVLFQAHDGPDELVKAARREMLQRYGGAVYRYLRASVGDPDAADELYQEFALRVVRGDFKRAHPDKGRFRDFLKTSLRNLIVDHERVRRRIPAALVGEGPAESAESVRDDADFIAAWRGHLLARAWDGLAAHPPLDVVLRLRTEQPELKSAQMAELLTKRLNQPVDAGWVRKRLHFAREKFADLLIAEVQQSLETAGEVADELLELGLYEYCRPALERGRRA